MNLPSNIFSINVKDFLKGLVMAVIAPVLVAVQQSLSAGELTLNWRALGMTAIAAFVGYLVKNFFTNSVPDAEETIAKAIEKARA